MTQFVRYTALAGGIGILLGPALYRVFDSPLSVSLGVLLLGAVTVVVGAITTLGAALFGRAASLDRRTLILLGVGLCIGLLPLRFLVGAMNTPAIHDVTTDMENPPAFDRAKAFNSPGRTDYPGEEVASQQRRAYPKIQPLILSLSVNDAFESALRVARESSWELLGVDVSSGMIEASEQTFWFGFTDDVVVRVRAQGEGSRVDVRSLSRVGVGDGGVNARRVLCYLERLAEDYARGGRAGSLDSQ